MRDGHATPALRVEIDPTGFTGWAALLDLLHAAYAFMDGRIDPPSSLLRMDAEAFRRKAAEETMILARAGDTLVGCVFAAPREGGLYVTKLAVREDLRGRGVARRLLQEVEELARRRGLAFLELQTRVELSENHAAFAALGFRRAGEHAHPGYDRTTSIVMRRPVAPGGSG